MKIILFLCSGVLGFVIGFIIQKLRYKAAFKYVKDQVDAMLKMLQGDDCDNMYKMCPVCKKHKIYINEETCVDCRH